MVVISYCCGQRSFSYCDVRQVATAAAGAGPAAAVTGPAAAVTAAAATTAAAAALPGVNNCEYAFDHYNSLWPMATTFDRSQRGYLRLFTNRV